jgi:hypothetical protein
MTEMGMTLFCSRLYHVSGLSLRIKQDMQAAGEEAVHRRRWNGLNSFVLSLKQMSGRELRIDIGHCVLSCGHHGTADEKKREGKILPVYAMKI